MSENSAIEWTHHTFNPWWGCAKVSPACDNCYAERDAGRHQPGRVLWGVDAERRVFGDSHWNEPLKWNRKAVKEGTRYRVFCASMADVFDKNAPDGARARLWKLIEDTPNLDWLILTKRVGNVERMMPALWKAEGWPPNVWLGISVVTQDEADRDIPKLRTIPAKVRFLSVEPMLEHIDLRFTNGLVHGEDAADYRLQWVIAGGESGPKARPMNPAWVFSIRDQCVGAGVPFLFKQWGEFVMADPRHHHAAQVHWFKMENGDAYSVVRVGKKAAGRTLDGRTWDEYP